jgi:hypothetical protein
MFISHNQQVMLSDVDLVVIFKTLTTYISIN